MNDPAFYKILAVLQVLMWSSFLYRYAKVLIRNDTLRRPHWHPIIAFNRLFSGQSILAKFAGAVLMIALAMVFYGLATVLRQFLGADYWGRDAVRITASTLILLSGLIFHIVLSRDKRRPARPQRRSTDLP